MRRPWWPHPLPGPLPPTPALAAPLTPFLPVSPLLKGHCLYFRCHTWKPYSGDQGMGGGLRPLPLTWRLPTTAIAANAFKPYSRLAQAGGQAANLAYTVAPMWGVLALDCVGCELLLPLEGKLQRCKLQLQYSLAVTKLMADSACQLRKHMSSTVPNG